MPAPAAIAPLSGPGAYPGEQPVTTSAGGSGGGVVGLVQNPRSGFSIGLGSNPTTEAPLWYDLTEVGTGIIVAGYDTSRGRSYELDKNSPGTATVRLVDNTGVLDPSGLLGLLEPGTQACLNLHNPVTDTWHPIFTGYISRWEYDLYQTQTYAEVTVELVDGMERLAQTEMYAGTGFTMIWGDTADLANVQDGDVWFGEDDQVRDRITLVLDQVGWPSGLREVFSGNVRVQEAVYAYRTPALNPILDAADAEFPGVANFYIQKDGRATFHGRFARFRPNDANYHIAVWRAGDMAAVASDSTRAVIFELAYDRDLEKVINSAISTPKGIADIDIESQRYESPSSIADYGSRSVSFDNLLTKEGHVGGTTPEQEARKFAQYYVQNYAQPRTRVNRITFKRLGPGDPYAQRVWRLMCNVDISDIIRLKTTHPGGGFDEDFYVEGLRYSATPLSEDYVDVTLELDVSPAAYYTLNPF